MYRNSKTVRGDNCALKFRHNPKRSSYRAAVVVSRKVSKSAVVRNRIRRRIYEAIQSQVQPTTPYDMVITIYSDTFAEIPSEDLHAALNGLLKKAAII